MGEREPGAERVQEAPLEPAPEPGGGIVPATGKSLAHHTRPDYGLDAPGIVRGFLAAGVLGILCWLTFVQHLWSGDFLGFPLAIMAGPAGYYCVGLAAAMTNHSRHEKLLERDRLLSRVEWWGGERVLDVGCGCGLMLIGAAQRLTIGRAVGVDIWQQDAPQDSLPEAVLHNARLEGVEDRVTLVNADMRQLPFQDASFDVVVTHWAIHSLYRQQERDQALREIVRVLKPGGAAIVADIQHEGEYRRVLQTLGLSDLERVPPTPGAMLLGLMSCGQFRPFALIGRKPDLSPRLPTATS